MKAGFALVGLVLLFAFAPAALAYDLSGIVLDPEGQPVADAQVWLSQDRAVRTAQTDEAGRFFFGEVDVGRMELVARREGLALGGTEGQVVGTAEVTVTLAKPDSIRLRIINTQFEVVVGARVKSLYIGDAFHVAVEDLVEHGFPSVRSDDEGFLSIPDLPWGSHASFAISHRSHGEAIIPTLPVGSELDVPLPRGVKLRGRITNEDREGIVRARISLFRYDSSAQREYTEVLSGSEGFYTAIVPPGRYYVAVRHADYAIPDPLPVVLAAGGEDTIHDVTLLPPHRILGSIVGPESVPISGVRLAYIARGYTFAEAFSDAEGGFELVVSSGEGVIRVTPPEGMLTVISPDILFRIEKTNEVLLKPIELKPLPELVGTVTLRDEMGPGQVLVGTINIDPPYWAVTDDQGRFRIQLKAVPGGAKVAMRAEHAHRFQRRDFAMDLRGGKPAKVKLKTFMPDLAPAPEWASNDLSHMVGDPAPELRCDAWFNLPPGVEEEGLFLADLRGKVIVLTLWGGFANKGASRNRIDELRALAYLYKDTDDVVIIAIHDAGKEPKEVAGYIKEFGIAFPVGCDADPFLTFDSYNTNFIPQTVLIDKSGVLRYYHVDGRLLELIKDLRRSG